MTVQVFALGGFGEIGRNCCAIDIDGKIILCDLGLHLENYLELDEEELFKRKHLLRRLMNAGALPDIRLLGKRKKDVVAIVCTHGHIDHIGGLPFLAHKFSCPVYATPFTAAVLTSLCNEKKQFPNVKRCPPGKSITVAGIQIDFIPVAHSTPQTVNLAIHTPKGIIIYGNDYKEDTAHGEQTAMNQFASYKGKTKLLIVDSLYAPTDEFAASENDATEQVLDLESKLKGQRLIIASTFSSHIYRIETLCDLADKLGRKIVFIGRSLSRYIEAAKQTDITDLARRGEVIKYSVHAKKFFAKLQNPSKYFIITTGHQGEPNAMLTRLVEGLYSFTPEDTIVFSSRVIPSEVTLKNSQILFEKIAKQGINTIRDVHVSGHAAGKDHAKLLTILKPELVIPSHADAHMMAAFKERALSLGYAPEQVQLLLTGQHLTL